MKYVARDGKDKVQHVRKKEKEKQMVCQVWNNILSFPFLERSGIIEGEEYYANILVTATGDHGDIRYRRTALSHSAELPISYSQAFSSVARMYVILFGTKAF